MSLRVRQYSLIHIDFWGQEILRASGCDCKYCTKFQLIHQELRKHKANKRYKWWRVNEAWGKISTEAVPDIETVS